MTKIGYGVVIGFILVLVGGGYLVYVMKKTNADMPQTATTNIPVVQPVATSTATSTASSTVMYSNTDFGFSLELPKSWEGYKLATGTVKFGQTITITPKSSVDEATREFMPILIYPIAQWKKWEKNNFEDYPTAAPIGPTERARNSVYVFATAPRYNFSFGVDPSVVENIVHSIKAF